jgi:hypothetical protein
MKQVKAWSCTSSASAISAGVAVLVPAPSSRRVAMWPARSSCSGVTRSFASSRSSHSSLEAAGSGEVAGDVDAAGEARILGERHAVDQPLALAQLLHIEEKDAPRDALLRSRVDRRLS